MSIRIDQRLTDEMLEHAHACHPEEACGLLAGPSEADIRMVFPITNVLHSSTNYTIDPKQHLQAIRAAEDMDWEIIGVFHSHPHTVGYPSITDVTLAPDPTWLYVLIGMEDFDTPTVRAFRIVEEEITEERIDIQEHTP